MVPGTPKAGVTIEEVVFKLQTLQVIGDSGSLGTSQEVDIQWKAGTHPNAMPFPTAPSGLYSKVTLHIDGLLLDNSYWINGHATHGGESYPFKIYDRDYLDLSLQIRDNLTPSGSATVPIVVALEQAIMNINWEKVKLNENDVLVIDTSDSYMPTFRKDIAKAFTINPQD
jgi:hypothetical protein